MYSVYKGDEVIAFGTLYQIAKQLNVKYKTVLFYGTPAYRNRTSNNARRLIKID